MVEPQEFFMPVPGYEEYYLVSNHGRVYSILNFKFLKPCPNNVGYLQVTLKGKKHLLHVIVAKVFHPNPQNLRVVHHIDEDPQNCAAWNLCWASHRENTAFSKYKISGSNNYRASINEKHVRDIMSLYEMNDSVKDISLKLDIPTNIIYKIVSGVSWRHVTGMKKRYYGKHKHKNERLPLEKSSS
jgi:hypothetical protein